jgi:aminopeptidase N
MNVKFLVAIIACNFTVLFCFAQSGAGKKQFSRADTIRGSIGTARSWWDVMRYDITVKPDFMNKTTVGYNIITYKVRSNASSRMQIDLQDPLQIDSVLFNGRSRLNFKKDGNAWFVIVPAQKTSTLNKVTVFFSGKPHEAIRAPWDGGWTFTTDSLNRPWMTVTCQGLGASVWYPCKDHQSDEPDKGASLTMIVPDTLVAVANGKLVSRETKDNGLVAYKWNVINPINNYNIIPYIGKYVNFRESYIGEKGNLDINYWVLDYNLEKARVYMPPEVKNMLKAFEHWFGPYPFYEDGYQLIDVSHTGMEHQSAIAYGNHYKPGYRSRDGSGTGWGMKWDFIIVHESGHEWFGNNITTKDLADMWVHEGFTNYSETLFVDFIFGEEAGNEYNAGIRRGIRNDKPIIPEYNVNAQGSGDMYPKAGNMLHAIRHSINNDSLFRVILRGLNSVFYHQTVTSAEVEAYISKHAGFNYQKVFDQYLRTTRIPEFQYYFKNNGQEVVYKWSNCVSGFNLPLVLKNEGATLTLSATDIWKTSKVDTVSSVLLEKKAIEKMYYITVQKMENP